MKSIKKSAIGHNWQIFAFPARDYVAAVLKTYNRRDREMLDNAFLYGERSEIIVQFIFIYQVICYNE